MYIIERIISIAIFLIITTIFALKLAKKTDPKHIKRTLVKYVLCLCTLSFFYVPAETADLTRLRVFVKSTYVDMSFSEYLNQLINTATYTTHTFYYFVAKIGIQELLSVISCAINYSIIGYVLYDYSKRNSIKGTGLANAFFLYMVTGQFLEVISGLRSMCAFSLFFLCIYREFFQNKKITSDLLIYFISIGFHSAVVPLVILRIIFLIVQSEKNGIKKLLNYIMFVVLGVVLLTYGIPVIENTIYKAEIYLNNDIYSYFWTYLSSILINILFVIIYLNNNETIVRKIPKNYRRFFIILLIVDSIFCFIEYSIFRRYNRVLVMLMLPIIMECFNYVKATQDISIRKKEIIYYIMLFAIMMIEISRGDLCGIRYFTFG